MARWREWFGAVVGMIVLIVGAIWRARRQGAAEGEARGRAEADRERLDEQVRQGDGGGIYRDITRGKP